MHKLHATTKAMTIVLFFTFFLGGLAVAAAATPPVTIRALLWRDSTNGPVGRTMAQAVEQFNRENSGLYKVLPQWVSPADSAKTLRSLMASGNAPDVFMTTYSGLAALAGSGQVYSLSSALAADPFWLGRFPAGVLEPLTFNGRTLAVPSAMRVGALFYNATLFDTLQLPVPHTLGDLTDDITRLRANGIVPIALGDRSGADGAILADQIAVRETGSATLDAALHGKEPWTDPGIVDTAKALDQLVAMNAFPAGFESMTGAQAIAAFEEGNAAMLYSSDPRLLSAFESDSSPIRGHVDVVPFPDLDSTTGGNPRTWIGVPELNLAISQASTVKPAAIAFVTSLSSPSVQRALAGAGLVPVTTEVLGLHPSAPLTSRLRLFTRHMTAMSLPSADVLGRTGERAYAGSIKEILDGSDPHVALAELNARESRASR